MSRTVTAFNSMYLTHYLVSLPCPHHTLLNTHLCTLMYTYVHLCTHTLFIKSILFTNRFFVLFAKLVKKWDSHQATFRSPPIFKPIFTLYTLCTVNTKLWGVILHYSLLLHGRENMKIIIARRWNKNTGMNNLSVLVGVRKTNLLEGNEMLITGGSNL